MSAFDLAAPICEALDLGDPNFVRKLTLTTDAVEAEIYLLNERGEKYFDLKRDAPATMVRVIPLEPGRTG